MAENNESDLVRKTISLAPDVYAKAIANAAKRGFAKSFSAYCAWLIERDAEGDVKRESVHHEPEPVYPALRVAEKPGGSDAGPQSSR